MEENLKKEIAQHITKNPTRHPNNVPSKQGTSMGIQNKKANRSLLWTKNTPRSPIPTTQKT